MMALYRIREDWREIYVIEFRGNNVDEVTEFLNRHIASRRGWTGDKNASWGGRAVWLATGEYNQGTAAYGVHMLGAYPGQFVAVAAGKPSVIESDALNYRYYEV